MQEHSFWIAEEVNHLPGPMISPAKNSFLSALYGFFGLHYVPAAKVIPDHVAFALIVFVFSCIFFLLVRRYFSMEKPGKIQHVLELAVEFLNAQMEEIPRHQEHSWRNGGFPLPRAIEPKKNVQESSPQETQKVKRGPSTELNLQRSVCYNPPILSWWICSTMSEDYFWRDL